jgi:membrane-associated phospholipid phosphatase
MTLRRTVGLLAAIAGMAGRARAQDPPPPADQDPTAAAVSSTETEQTTSLKLLLPHIAQDQKRIWLFPLKAASGKKGWKPALGIIGATAGLIALDPHDTPFFQRASFQQAPAVREFNRIVSGRNAAFAIAAVPVSFYIAGLVRQRVRQGAHKDSYASQTALLAGEAVASAEIVAAAMKAVDRRLRPGLVGPGGDYSDTWFRQQGPGTASSGSFPSAHTTAAFSVATVFARRYRSHRWVPWVAYGLAGVIGFSRVSGQAHFPSDVFTGAALGFSISRFAVLER